MFKFLDLEPDIFGIDVNDLALRIVKLEKKHKGFKVVSYNEIDVKSGIIKEGVIQDPEALVKVIKTAVASVKGKRLGTKYVNISLPEEKSFSQVIQMPNMTHDELKLSVPLEAENYIPLTIDKVYLDFQAIGSRATKTGDNVDLLINVMPRAIVDSYVECFKKAGLTPSILEVESQAIARALIKKGSTHAPLIFIDLGNASTSFIIFAGDSVHFTCSIPISSKQITDAIAKSFDITAAKAEELKVKYGASKKGDKKYDTFTAMEPILSQLAVEIKKYIIFYRDHVSHPNFASEGSIEKIILCGGGANLKELPAFLFEKLKIPIEIGNPFTNMVVAKNGQDALIPYQKALSFTTALGLALRGASQKS